MSQRGERDRKLSGELVDNGERLESWKEIATFLGRGVRTVQRWEEVEGLPVHRHLHERGGTVIAYKSELKQWWDQRQTNPPAEIHPPSAPRVVAVHLHGAAASTARHRFWWTGSALAIILAAFAAGALLERPPAVLAPSILTSQIGRISQTVLSPRGDRFVYCWNGNREEKSLDLYLWDRLSGSSRRLTSHPNNEHSHSAAWSPEGDRVAFLRDEVGVFVMTAAGRDERMLEAARPGTMYGVGMSWSPDAQWLVYSERETPTAPPNLFVLSTSSGTRRQLTRQPPSSKGDTYPSFAPDGLSIAFVRAWPGGRSGLQLLHLSLAGQPVGDPEQLDVDAHFIAGLDWLPDGRGLVYSSDRTGLRHLWRIDYSPWRRRWSPPELLASAGDDAWQPSIARRGQQMIYSRRFWNAAIWRMDLKSAAKSPPVLSRLIGSTRIERSPAYSPDGARVAFVSDRSGSAEIWTSDRDGHSETQLTQLRHLEPGRPAWSPDARWIAFSGGSAGREGIYAVPSAGGIPTRVTSEKLACNSPTWSHDGMWIYCSSAVEQIWKVPGTGGEGVFVTAGLRPGTSTDGRWLYFVRRGELWRMPAGGGTEEKLIDAPVGDFALTSRGVYFDLGSGDYTDGVIKFCNPADRSITVISQLERRKSGGLTVSPDDGSLLVPINERQSSEVLLLGEASK